LRNFAKSIVAGRARGFTLIELLVTIVIISIILSIAVMSLSLVGDDREVRKEAQRLMSLIEVAQDDAILQGREFGVEFLLGSYRFVEYEPISGQWSEILGADLLRTRQIPAEMEFSLFLEDKRIALEETPIGLADTDEDGAGVTAQARNYAPHIMIFSSGDMTPFEVHINRVTDQLSVALQGDLLGNLEFVDDEDTQF
jgi:general secretion pathway protein H